MTEGQSASSAEAVSNVIEETKRRMDMLDRRLDDIDSMVTALVERVMSQPVSVAMNCPHCGKRIDMSLVGNRRPAK